MTMESTVPSTEAIDNTARYPLDPLTGAEIETAAAVITDSEYATPTLKFVMIQLAEPGKTPELTFDSAVDVPRSAARDWDRTCRRRMPAPCSCRFRLPATRRREIQMFIAK